VSVSRRDPTPLAGRWFASSADGDACAAAAAGDPGLAAFLEMAANSAIGRPALITILVPDGTQAEVLERLKPLLDEGLPTA